VATVSRIERDASAAFARIVCEPAAGVDKHRFVLVLANELKQQPYPEAADAAGGKRTGKTRKSRRKDGDAAAR
jgi:rod shape-determining protein MreC